MTLRVENWCKSLSDKESTFCHFLMFVLLKAVEEAFTESKADLDGKPLDIDGLPIKSSDVDGVPIRSSDMDGFPIKQTDIDGVPLSSDDIDGKPSKWSIKCFTSKISLVILLTVCYTIILILLLRRIC